MKNMHKLMKQAQQMQSKIVKPQEEMADHQEEATVGGGVVTAAANGKGELVSLKISPEVVEAEEVEMLQDLIVAATNEALRKAREAVEEEMKKATGGLGLPGMM